jgi:hypothetical protein
MTTLFGIGNQQPGASQRHSAEMVAVYGCGLCSPATRVMTNSPRTVSLFPPVCGGSLCPFLLPRLVRGQKHASDYRFFHTHPPTGRQNTSSRRQWKAQCGDEATRGCKQPSLDVSLFCSRVCSLHSSLFCFRVFLSRGQTESTRSQGFTRGTSSTHYATSLLPQGGLTPASSARYSLQFCVCQY